MTKNYDSKANLFSHSPNPNETLYRFSEYLNRPGRINVISIDYGPLVREGCYIPAIENTDLVANCTAQFLEHLLKIRRNIRLSQIHFVALSLGAQVAGQMSHYLTVGQIERISCEYIYNTTLSIIESACG